MAKTHELADDELAKSLREPFAPQELDWTLGKQDAANNRAVAIPKVKPLEVLDRLNHTPGPGRWTEDHSILPSGEVHCVLSIIFEDQWVRRSGVSNPPRAESAPITYRAGFAESLVAAAFKFGVGAYLQRLPTLFAEVNPTTKQMVKPPALPQWAIPEGWRAAGEEHAAKVRAIIEQVAKETNRTSASVTLELVRPFGYDATTSLATVPVVHLRLIQQAANAAINVKARKTPAIQ